MRLFVIVAFAALFFASCASAPATTPPSTCPELATLSPAARAEVLAIAKILAAKPRFARDFTRVGMHALAVGHDTMVTFAADPSTTKEDIIFFIPAKGLIRAGLDVRKYDAVPAREQMVSGKWYYSTGREPEPRFNNNAIGTPVLMMAIDSEAP